MVKGTRDIAIIYGGQHLGNAAERILAWADTQRPAGIMGRPISFWGDLAGTIGGVVGAMRLRAPWDMIAALMGGHMSTNLLRHFEAMFAAGLPVASKPVAAASLPAVVTPPASAFTQSKYVITG